MIATIFRGIFATLEGDIPKHMRNKAVIRSLNGLANGSASKLQDKAKAEAAAAMEAKKKAQEAKVFELGAKFAEIILPLTFSPAEIQGYLLEHKRDPAAAVRDAADWVLNTAQTKENERRAKEEKEVLEENEDGKVEQ